MFRNRNFLLGLGIGLAFGAMLLELMMIGRAVPEQTERIDRMNGEDALYTQSELEERIAAAEERIRAELSGNEDAAADPDSEGAAGQDGSGDPGDVQPDAGDATAQADQEENDPADPAAKPESVVVEKLPVRIKPGMKLGEIAELLHSKGIIKDQKVFLVLMSDVSTEIEAGFYFFDGELSPADVKKTILSPPFAY